MSNLISSAHPTIQNLHCALLHPSEPSCLKTYVLYWANTLPRTVRILAAVYTASWLPRYKKLLSSPTSSLATIIINTLRTAVFVTGTLGTSWALSCAFQSSPLLPRRAIPKTRFHLAGLIAGLFAFVDRHNNRGTFLYTFRVFLASAWKSLVNRGYVRNIKHGDVALFVAALAAVEVVFEKAPESVTGGGVRKVLGSLRGKGWRDGVREKREREERRRRREEKGGEDEAGEERGRKDESGRSSEQTSVESSTQQTPALTEDEAEKEKAVAA